MRSAREALAGVSRRDLSRLVMRSSPRERVGPPVNIHIDYSCRFLARHASLQGYKPIIAKEGKKERKKEIESQRKRGRLIYEA